MFQIIELQGSERDIEKEHLAQLRQWKETRGDLNCKSPPRMHGAKAIITADPPSRQDLRQRPTIIVESPLASKSDEQGKEETEEKTRGENNTEAPSLPAEMSKPYLSPSDQSPLPKHMSIQGSNESLSSAEHDTYL